MGGAAKKSKKPLLKRIFSINTLKLFLICILLGFLSATFLRFDNVTMTNLRQEVIDADSDGDTELRDRKLAELRNFTFSHIVVNLKDDNGAEKVTFGTGTFYLEGSYLRDADKAIQDAQQTIDQNTGSNPNGNVYKKVATICDARAKKNGWSYPDTNYINCYQTELSKYKTDEIMTDLVVDIPSTENYRVEYSSPVWYPCISGIFILLTVVFAIVTAARFIIWLILHIAVLILDHLK